MSRLADRIPVMGFVPLGDADMWFTVDVPQVQRLLIDVLPSLHKIVIDDCALSLDEQEFDYGTGPMRLPYDMVFMEFVNRPEFVAYHDAPKYCGVLAREVFKEPDEDFPDASEKLLAFDFIVQFRKNERMYFPVATVLMYRNPDDTMCGFRWNLGKKEISVPENEGLIHKLLWPICRALHLLNCQNITTERVDPDAKLSKKHRKKHKRPLVSYHVLKLSLPGERVDEERPRKPVQGINRLHLVRGHTATYSQERPLFGKYEGTFWVPAHARGNKKRGVLLKDYEVQKASHD